jgi:hypothetical protein
MVTPYVPDDRLARFRALDERAMPDTCQVAHTAPGTVNPDGSDEPGTVTTTTYACRVAPSGGSPQETLIASRLTDVTPFTVVLPFDAAVNETDTITYAGGTLQVMGTLAPSTYMTSVRAVCKRLS